MPVIRMSYESVYKSDQAQTAQTPKHMLKLLGEVYFRGRAVFDPCPANPKWDGLAISWKKLNYVNCEFRALPEWCMKAVEESASGRETVMLMPARLNTKYFHKLMRGARTIAIWFNSISFLPFEGKFPVSIVTVQVGGVARSLASRSVRARQVRADAWTMVAPMTHARLAHAIRTRLAPIARCTPTTLLKKGRSMLLLTSDFADGVSRAVEHCKENQDAVVVVHSITMFHGVYMQAAYPLIRQIIFLSEPLVVNGLKCFASNQILVLAKRDVAYGTRTCALPPVWLLNARDHHIHD